MQNEVDIALAITTPRGEILHLDGFTSCYGDEPFGLVVSQTGWIRLEIQTLKFSGEVILETAPARLAEARARAFDKAFRARVRAGREKSFRAGLPYYRQAAVDWEGAGEPVLAAEMKAWQAYGLQADGRSSQALDLMAEAARELRAAGDLPRTVTVLIELGTLQRRLDYPERAERSYRDAILLAERGKLHWLRGEAYRSLGVLKSEAGLLQHALFAYHQAISIFEGLGERERRAAALSNLGAIYTLMGALDQAEAVLDQALDDQRPLGPSYRLGLTLSRKGRLLMLRDRYHEALQSLSEAQRVLRQANRHNDADYTLNILALTYRRMGQFPMAEKLLQQTIHDFEERGEVASTAVSRANLALVLESAGKTERALAEAQSAWEVLKTGASPENHAVLLFLMARIAKQQGDLQRASTLMVGAMHASESMRNNTASSDFGRSFTGVRDDYHDFYLDLLYGQYTKDPAGKAHLDALAHVDQLKTRGLGPSGGHDKGPRSELNQKETELELLEQKRQATQTGHADAASLAAIRREMRTVLETLDRLRAAMDGPTPEQALPADEKFWDSKDTTWLEPDTALLVYKLAEPRSYLWLVQKEGIDIYALPSDRKIRELALPWIRLMRTPCHGADAAQRALLARELGRVLLGPVAHRLDENRLLVVKDGILHRLPLAALINSATEEPLVASHDLVCLPSVSFAATLAARTPTEHRPISLAIFADPDYGHAGEGPIADAQAFAATGRSGEDLALAAEATALESLPPLPGSRREAEVLRAMVPETAMFLGKEANVGAFYDLDPRAYSMFHFALHGLLHPFETRLSGLVFALVDPSGSPRPGFLRARDVARLDMPADLVTLSACHTGRGEDSGAEGIWGLTQAFLEAGAHRVVAGLWSADDWATAELMPHFYRAMTVESLPPASALRRAQNILRTDGAYTDPSYWAGFELHGDWR